MPTYARCVRLTLLLGACLCACSANAPPSVTVTKGERTATAVELDGVYHGSVVESGRLVFEVEVRPARGTGVTFDMRLFEQAAVVLEDELHVDDGKIVDLEAIANFALAGYHFKSRERRQSLGLPVAQDRPGCDAIVASCGQHGICCDRHDKCLEDANDTSQSRSPSQFRLRKPNNCDAEALGCVAVTATGVGAGPSDCCRIPGPGSPTCSPAGTYVDRCGSNNCCNGAVDAFTGGFCSSPYSPGYCISGPKPEPYPYCQWEEKEWSTWGGHGPPNYWSNARCGDGVCSPGEHISWFDSFDGNCKSDCGYVPRCDWYDCNGTCEGNERNDACGVCGGDGSSCACNWYDCEGTCNGNVWNDTCGVCGGDGSSCACSWYDCAGTCNGNATTDSCGVCGGDGSSCLP